MAKNVCGFYTFRIKNKKKVLYIALLPFINKKGIAMPNGKWAGWYFYIELKFAE